MQSEKIIQKFQFFKPIQSLNEKQSCSNASTLTQIFMLWLTIFMLFSFMLFSFMLCLNFGVNKVIDYKYKDEITQQKVVINDINKELTDKGINYVHYEHFRGVTFNITSDESKKEELVTLIEKMIKDRKIENVDMKYDFIEKKTKARFVVNKF